MSEPLECTITSFISDGILYGIANSILQLEAMFQQVMELIEKAKEEDIHKFLFDHHNVTLDFDKSNIFHLSHQLKDLGLKEEDKFAVLLPADSYFHQWYTRFETSSVFHGNKVKIFNNESNALRWLKQ
jgi:hypothetical protein